MDDTRTTAAGCDAVAATLEMCESPSFTTHDGARQGELCPSESLLCFGVAPQPADDVASAGTGADEPRRVVEALLFASDAPLSAGRLAELLGAGGAKDVRGHVDALNAGYEQAGLSFRIEHLAGGYQMMTLPEFRPWLSRLHQQKAETRLSEAALEALSIIAYRQPIMRADIESIRGVACGDVLTRLRDAGLIKVVGRAEIVGRPMLFGTTRKFLDVFGLGSLDDLPPMESLKLRPAQSAAAPEGAAAESRAVAAAGA